MFLILKSSAWNRWLNNEHVYSRGIAPAQKSVVLPPPAPASALTSRVYIVLLLSRPSRGF